VPIYRAHRRFIGPCWLFLISRLFFETASSAATEGQTLLLNAAATLLRTAFELIDEQCAFCGLFFLAFILLLLSWPFFPYSTISIPYAKK
jgi:hypothetical protein